MAELKIYNINDYKYTLVDEKNKKGYTLIFEFYNTPKVSIGDKICMDAKLLDVTYPGYAQPYAFECVEVNEINKTRKEDYAILKTKQGTFLLKRLYG